MKNITDKNEVIMSFVNLVITDSFISVISDGQVTKNNEITASHFKKFETSQNGYVIASTGYEKITNDIRKKFYYQPHLTFDDAQMLLLESIKKYQNKSVHFSKKVSYNAIIAGFVSTDNSQIAPFSTVISTDNTTKNTSTPSHPSKKRPVAYCYHVADGNITRTFYDHALCLSLIPDDIDFNPNLLLSTALKKLSHHNALLSIQALQRSILYQVAQKSNTVNTVIFQALIKKD